MAWIGLIDPKQIVVPVMISGTDKRYFSKIKTISSNKICQGINGSRDTRWEKVM
jgi:hypothetical protein